MDARTCPWLHAMLALMLIISSLPSHALAGMGLPAASPAAHAEMHAESPKFPVSSDIGVTVDVGMDDATHCADMSSCHADSGHAHDCCEDAAECAHGGCELLCSGASPALADLTQPATLAPVSGALPAIAIRPPVSLSSPLLQPPKA